MITAFGKGNFETFVGEGTIFWQLVNPNAHYCVDSGEEYQDALIVYVTSDDDLTYLSYNIIYHFGEIYDLS